MARNPIQAPAHVPVLGVGDQVISISAALMEHLRWKHVQVNVIDGKPVLSIDPEGCAVSAYARQGVIYAPSVARPLRDQLGAGTKWVMERAGDTWTGRPLESADLADTSRRSFVQLPQVAEELMRRMLRDGLVTVAPGYSTADVLSKAQIAATIAWGDVRRGRTCERA